MMMKNFRTIGGYFIFSLALFLVFAAIQPASAQPPGDPCPGGPPCDPDVPITGIEWLLVAGGLFGVRMVKRKLKD